MVKTVITLLSYSETVALLRTKKDVLQDDGTFFAICSTEYNGQGNVVHDFLDLIEEATSLGYTYVNTIVYPTKCVQKVSFTDNVRYVVWFCKNHANMSINKDVIREKHIWKDVEWGKRTKNYNPKGKDPGNVWIPTHDDGKAKITEHILLEDQDVINRIIALADCGSNYEVFKSQLSVAAMTPLPTIQKSSIQMSECEGRIFFKTSEDMYDIEDGAVSVVVTSPPYWNLKDYFKAGQIGQESYEVYLKRMRSVWSECYKKLSRRGSLWININIRVQAGKVISIPRDFVKICKEIGFCYKGIYIWHKSSGIPTSEKNIVERHEYVLLFTKSEDFRVDPAVEISFADYKNDNINGGAFWNINRKAGSVGKKYIHPAIYPNALAARIIMLSSNEGELVMDPFLGSGTSLIAAMQCNRHFIGYEFNEGFKELMLDRFKNELHKTSDIKFV